MVRKKKTKHLKEREADMNRSPKLAYTSLLVDVRLHRQPGSIWLNDTTLSNGNVPFHISRKLKNCL